MKVFLSILLFSFFLSCNQSNKEQTSEKTVILPAEPSKFEKREDCYSDRNVVKIVNDTKAKVLTAGKFGILDCYELGDRYQPGDLPDWAVVGEEVIVSGVAKEVHENERRAGTPFFISTISKP